MKYLKLFESNEYYTQISRDDYTKKIGFDGGGWDENFISDTWVSFTEKELEFIKNLTKGDIKEVMDDVPSIGSYIRVEHTKIDRKTRIVEYHYLWINKSKDEWYYLNDYNSLYYKCDQFEGLIACLKNEISYLKVRSS